MTEEKEVQSKNSKRKKNWLDKLHTVNRKATKPPTSTKKGAKVYSNLEITKNLFHLLENYKENVLASYTPRSEAGLEVQEYNKYQKSREQKLGTRLHKKKLTYRHTGIFLDSIYTEVKNKTVMVKIRDTQYPDGATTTQVYEWLTKGTEGSEKSYPYTQTSGNDSTNPDNYSTGWSRNFPTPRHLFEEHTREQMKGFLASFEENIKNDYKKRKYKRRK